MVKYYLWPAAITFPVQSPKLLLELVHEAAYR